MNTRLLRKRHQPPPHPLLRALRVTAGLIVLLAGVVLAVPLIPGPGVVLILVGLWIVSADIGIARRALMRMRISARRARRKFRKRREQRQDGRSET